MTQTDKMLSRKEGGVGYLIFNNPERHNAVSLEMWNAASGILADFASDNAIRVVVLTGAGGKAFVSGADISKFESERSSKDAIDRFMQAYRETIDYMYSDNPQVLKDYAAFVQVSEPMAKRVRDEFFPKSLVDPDAIKGVDSVMKEAVNLKFISEPLTQKQLDELIQIPPRKM